MNGSSACVEQRMQSASDLPLTGTSLGAKFSESMGRARSPVRGLVPGAGFEPAFLDSETSVLPARRSRSDGDVGTERAPDTRHPWPRRAPEVARRSSRSGGNRTLTTSIKSRVRLPITLRTRADTRSRGTRGSRTLIPRGKSPVLGHIELAPRCQSERTTFELRGGTSDTKLEKHD